MRPSGTLIAPRCTCWAPALCRAVIAVKRVVFPEWGNPTRPAFMWSPELPDPTPEPRAGWGGSAPWRLRHEAAPVAQAGIGGPGRTAGTSRRVIGADCPRARTLSECRSFSFDPSMQRIQRSAPAGRPARPPRLAPDVETSRGNRADAHESDQAYPD